ncbi:hypothetical protein BGZ63DRAFT_409698 [Mariannaea sp. PMI_226]|nr:hypothetical protein BGZ63DRAFT_409698 [Mariannaea sp. PMI_226]
MPIQYDWETPWTVNMRTNTIALSEDISPEELECLSLLILFSALSVIALMVFLSWSVSPRMPNGLPRRISHSTVNRDNRFVVQRLEHDRGDVDRDDPQPGRHPFSIEN